MRIELDGALSPAVTDVVVGNVYPVRGGRGGSRGHMNVVVAVTQPKSPYDLCGPSVLMLTVDKDGDPVSVTKYGLHYVQDLIPIAFVDGLDQITLTMRPL